MTAFVSWEEPPASVRTGTGRRSRFADALDELRKNPGKWARITETPLDEPSAETNKALSHAARIRGGHIAEAEAGEFGAKDHEGHVYACYLGQDGIDATKAKQKKRAEKKAAKEAAAAEGKPVDEADDADDDDDDDTDPGDPDADENGDQLALPSEPAVAAAPMGVAGSWG